jgi:divalent metal cation (Fe/Co/Zn/Cd) transporter
MAIKQPGTQSNVSLLSSGVLAIILLIILIGGHVILGYLVLSSIFGDGGLKSIATDTAIPTWGLVLMVVGAVIMDAWIFYSMRQARKRRNAR